MTAEIYQLKISAKYIKPGIWRTVLVPANATFLDLHEIIMNLFGFDNSHLFAFRSGAGYENQISDGMEGSKKAAKIKLSQQFMNNTKMDYTYDFGDDWQFTIELQKTLPRAAGSLYPQCIKWKGGMMLEDCGGYYGYEVITNWCRNKTKANAKELIDFYGYEEILESYANFNPDEFDPNSIVLTKL